MSGKRRPKYLFTKSDWQGFNETLWTADDLHNIHARMRVQLAFLVSLFITTGARIRAFFPTKGRPDNPGLRYKVNSLLEQTTKLIRQDIEIVMIRTDNASWKIIYEIEQRWVKNNRDPENIRYVYHDRSGAFVPGLIRLQL